MEEKLTKAFHNLEYAPDPDLGENAWRAIVASEHKTTRAKVWLFSFLGFFSFAGLLPMLKTLSGEFTRSGFYDYLSLIFSDGKSVAMYWKELAFSLLESLPILGILISLTLVFIFFLSVRYAIKQAMRNQLSLSFKI